MSETLADVNLWERGGKTVLDQPITFRTAGKEWTANLKVRALCISHRPENGKEAWDDYYIVQNIMFNPSPVYQTKFDHIVGHFVESYAILTWPSEFADEVDAMSISSSSPHTTNGQITTGFSSTFDVNTQIGYMGGPMYTVGANCSSTFSHSYTLPDVQTSNYSGTSVSGSIGGKPGNAAAWRFYIPPPKWRDDWGQIFDRTIAKPYSSATSSMEIVTAAVWHATKRPARQKRKMHFSTKLLANLDKLHVHGVKAGIWTRTSHDRQLSTKTIQWSTDIPNIPFLSGNQNRSK